VVFPGATAEGAACCRTGLWPTHGRAIKMKNKVLIKRFLTDLKSKIADQTPDDSRSKPRPTSHHRNGGQQLGNPWRRGLTTAGDLCAIAPSAGRGAQDYPEISPRRVAQRPWLQPATRDIAAKILAFPGKSHVAVKVVFLDFRKCVRIFSILRIHTINQCR